MGCADTVHAFVAEGANTELRDNDGKSAMDYAQGKVDVIRALQPPEYVNVHQV